jgi:uncharacterized membrane protein
MLELIYRPLVMLHVFTGTLALIASVVAFATVKGSRSHNRSGQVFYLSMLITSLASLPTAVHSGKWVLFFLAIFCYYLTFTGKRYLSFRRGAAPNGLDYVTSGGMVVFGLLLMVVGVPFFYANMGMMGALAPIAFGLIGIGGAREDYFWYTKRKQDPKVALKLHIGRMGGASISAFTAFLVNVNTIIPGGMAWLIPTIIGSFLIAYHQRKLRLSR